jgi:hypothetical protein
MKERMVWFTAYRDKSKSGKPVFREWAPGSIVDGEHVSGTVMNDDDWEIWRQVSETEINENWFVIEFVRPRL